MSRTLNQRMGDAHEWFLVDLIGGRKSKGSGNQWRDPMDGRNNRLTTAYAFAFDGKSTLSKSVGVTREMWAKAREQAGGERPMLALRFYDNERLDVGLDLVVLDPVHFSEVLAAARERDAFKECLVEGHDVEREDIGSPYCPRCGLVG